MLYSTALRELITQHTALAPPRSKGFQVAPRRSRDVNLSHRRCPQELVRDPQEGVELLFLVGTKKGFELLEMFANGAPNANGRVRVGANEKRS